jgi:DNA-binding transcriptional LysR family regulator
MSSGLDLNHVELFVKVVESESFTRAAAQLGLPKSSVSRAVSSLESKLGVRLLERTTRRLRLTEAGRAYFEQAQSALTGLKEAAATAAEMSKGARGTVRITAPVDVGLILLIDVIARFTHKYPEIHVDLSLSSLLVDMVEQGFDLAVRAGRLADSTLVTRRVGNLDLGLFAAKSYLETHGTPRSIEDLRRHHAVLFRGKGGRARWSLLGPEGERSVEVHGPLSVDDVLLVRRAIGAGLGVGLLPAFAVAGSEASADNAALVRVLPDHVVQGGALNVITASVRHLPKRVLLFRDFLVMELSARGAAEGAPARTPKAAPRTEKRRR